MMCIYIKVWNFIINIKMSQYLLQNRAQSIAYCVSSNDKCWALGDWISTVESPSPSYELRNTQWISVLNNKISKWMTQ